MRPQTVRVYRRRLLCGLCTVAAAASMAPAAGAQDADAAAAGMQPGIWISKAELRKLPERGRAWEQLVKLSDQGLGKANLSNQDSEHDIKVLANAMVAARTGERKPRKRAAKGIMKAIGTEERGRTLSLARGLQAYVIAADLIALRDYDADKDSKFREWLRKVRNEDLKPSDNPTLVLTHELRPNNWGTHAGASRIAADIYLGDRKDLARAAAVFKGWLGDRGVYDGFVFGERSWQGDPKAPVGVNGAGTERDGIAVGGALPEEMRRGCAPREKPCPTRYPWEAMQGAVAQAEMLSRQGYDAWHWGDDGLRRAATYLFDLARSSGQQDFAAPAGHGWVPWLLNARYGTRFPQPSPAPPGKGLGFTDWTAAARRGANPIGPQRGVSAVAAPEQPKSDLEKTAPLVGAVGLTVAAMLTAATVVVLRARRGAADDS